MTIQSRKEAFDTISKTLAITRYDIEQHQAINDLSLNIHGENFFRDVFRIVYEPNFDNENINNSNAEFIDLVNHNTKEVIQITTTRSKDKIKHSLNVLRDSVFSNYKFKIFYLLEKAKPQSTTVSELEKEFEIDNLIDSLQDYSDLIKDINNLDEEVLIHLCNKHFSDVSQKYTKVGVLNLICKRLIKRVKSIEPAYDDPLGGIDPIDKIDVNKLNKRVAANLLFGLDYTQEIYDSDDSDIPTELRELVVDQLYRKVLEKQLVAFMSKDDLKKTQVRELQDIAYQKGISFNLLIDKLKDEVKALIDVDDFNGINIPWTIVAFYFEICLVGRDKK